MNKDQDAVAVIGNIIMPIVSRKQFAMQPMTSSNGELHLGTAYLGGSKEGEWFTVMVGKPFIFSVKGELKGENKHLNWCKRTFGESYNHLTDQCFWFERDGRYYFRKEEDRTMFILKWQE